MENKNKEFVKLGVFLLVVLVILGGFIIYLSVPLLGSKSVILATTPVDPFDPIRGQYMIIRYEISSVPLVAGAQSGDSVFVILRVDDGGVARHHSSSLVKPSGDELFIRGKINFVSSNIMSVDYGVEQYFFERGGSFSERINEVEVKLSGSGQARIVNILNDGVPIVITSEERDFKS